jgi:MYXO-CTERM domain-containing protein
VKPEPPKADPPREAKKPAPRKRSGCGCATGGEGASLLAGLVLALLLVTRRRARR